MKNITESNLVEVVAQAIEKSDRHIAADSYDYAQELTREAVKLLRTQKSWKNIVPSGLGRRFYNARFGRGKYNELSAQGKKTVTQWAETTIQALRELNASPAIKKIAKRVPEKTAFGARFEQAGKEGSSEVIGSA